MTQSHVVKRGSQFYFRIAVPLSLPKLVGKREIKASLRTSDAMSAKMRGRVLSNGLDLLFRELRPMSDVSNDVIVNRAKDYFKAQLSKSLEHALLLPTAPLIDIDFEIAGTEQLAAKMREALKQQHFSPSVQSDAYALLNPTNPNADPYTPQQLVEGFKSPIYTGHKSKPCRHKPGSRHCAVHQASRLALSR